MNKEASMGWMGTELSGTKYQEDCFQLLDHVDLPSLKNNLITMASGIDPHTAATKRREVKSCRNHDVQPRHDAYDVVAAVTLTRPRTWARRGRGASVRVSHARRTGARPMSEGGQLCLNRFCRRKLRGNE